MNEWSNEKKYEFAFNNQLPRVFEVVNAIIAVDPSAAHTRAADSLDKKAAVHAAARALEKLWGEAFAACHVKSINAIKNHINNILSKYHNFMKNNIREKTKESPNGKNIKSGVIKIPFFLIAFRKT